MGGGYFYKLVFLYVTIGTIFGTFLIKYVKSFATSKAEHYIALNNLTEIKRALCILYARYKEVLTFQTKETLVSIYFYLAIFLFIALIAFIIKKKLFWSLISDKWIVFFIGDFLVVFCTFLISSWVLSNEMGRWYFVATYISLSMAILLILENICSLHNTLFLKSYLIIIVLIGSVSPVYTMITVSPKRLKPMVQVVGEFKQLGKIGIIGEFWNSYLSSCPDPNMIKAVTHDKCYLRNPMLVDSVFARKNIYVIRDMWMKNFPDTLEQYGYVLVKDGNAFKMGNCDICKYKKSKLHKLFPWHNFNNSSLKIFDDRIGKDVLLLKSNPSLNYNYFIKGPIIPLGIGEYILKIRIKGEKLKYNYGYILIIVSTMKEESTLLSEEISQENFSSKEYSDISFSFRAEKRYDSINFKIYAYGKADFYLDNLEIIQK